MIQTPIELAKDRLEKYLQANPRRVLAPGDSGDDLGVVGAAALLSIADSLAVLASCATQSQRTITHPESQR